MRIRTVTRFIKKAIPSATRKAVAVRHRAILGASVVAKCSRCQASGKITWFTAGWVHFQDLELDHIVPEFKGGDASPSNIQLLCRRCNRSKGTK